MGNDHLLDQVEALRGQTYQYLAAVVGAGPFDKAALRQPIDTVRDGTGGDHRLAHEVASGEGVGFAGAPQGRQHVVHPVLYAESGEVLGKAPVDEPRQPRHPADDPDRRDVEVGTDRVPLTRDPVDRIRPSLAHARMVPAGRVDAKILNIKIVNVKSTRAATTWTAGATLLAPVSWGTSYVTITELLPDGRPLLVATMRVLPAGLGLVLASALSSRWRPRGAEWWRTGTLALFNFGLFFPLLVVAVYRLPGGIAAAVGGLQPLLVAALSWLVTARRPRWLDLAVGCAAVVGVGLVVSRPGAGVDPVGVLAAVGANVSFAAGVVLTKLFPVPPHRFAATGWQLLLGGVFLLPLTALVEGTPPAPTATNLVAFAYLSLAATAVAFVLWFNGIRQLPTAAPPLLGLAAPLTGAALGWAVLGESLSPLQLTGFGVTASAIAYAAWLPGHERSYRRRAMTSRRRRAAATPHGAGLSCRGSLPSHRRTRCAPQESDRRPLCRMRAGAIPRDVLED